MKEPLVARSRRTAARRHVSDEPARRVRRVRVDLRPCASRGRPITTRSTASSTRPATCSCRSRARSSCAHGTASPSRRWQHRARRYTWEELGTMTFIAGGRHVRRTTRCRGRDVGRWPMGDRRGAGRVDRVRRSGGGPGPPRSRSHPNSGPTGPRTVQDRLRGRRHGVRRVCDDADGTDVEQYRSRRRVHDAWSPAGDRVVFGFDDGAETAGGRVGIHRPDAGSDGVGGPHGTARRVSTWSRMNGSRSPSSSGECRTVRHGRRRRQHRPTLEQPGFALSWTPDGRRTDSTDDSFVSVSRTARPSARSSPILRRTAGWSWIGRPMDAGSCSRRPPGSGIPCTSCPLTGPRCSRSRRRGRSPRGDRMSEVSRAGSPSDLPPQGVSELTRR